MYIKCEGISEGLRLNKKLHLLIVPYVKYKTCAYHLFSVCGPRLWNNTKAELQESDYGKFKKGIKNTIIH